MLNPEPGVCRGLNLSEGEPQQAASGIGSLSESLQQ
jgi:hypothetical protein